MSKSKIAVALEAYDSGKNAFQASKEAGLSQPNALYKAIATRAKKQADEEAIAQGLCPGCKRPL
jgi:hemoglobin-like flavoprotein